MTAETPQAENEAAGGQSRAGEAGANLTAVLYVVSREGVYRHEILGIYRTQVMAEARAKEVAMHEPDGWHDIQVSTATLDRDFSDVTRVSYFNKRDV